MTGFGTGQSRSSKLELDVSIKSLNGRFLEIRSHLPKDYGVLESDIKAAIARYLNRGTVDVYVTRRQMGSDRLQIHVHKPALEKWLKVYKQVSRAVGSETPPSFESIVNLPEVVAVQQDTEVAPAEKAQVLKLIVQAAKACAKERAREGRALQRALESHFKDLQSLLKKMEIHIDQANSELYKKFTSRLERTHLNDKVDGQRIAQEVAVFLDRCDVSEEIQRLSEHLRACLDLIKSKESQGKKLDFYTQELLREVNTIGSKSQLAELTELVVDAKSVIEKIKEQVQNVA